MSRNARYCVKCGKAMRFKMRNCPRCGQKIQNPDKSAKKYMIWSAIPIFGWIIGLILFFTLQNEYPKKADSAAKGVVIGVSAVMGAAIVFFLAKMISVI